MTINLLGGIAFVCLGIWLTVNEVRTFMKGKQDRLGSDIKLLAGGILLIIAGIYLITK